MARPDDLPDAAEQSADTVEHLLALDRVGLRELELLIGELRGLVQDLLRDDDLSDVVEESGELDLLALFGIKVHPLGHGADQVHD